MLSKEYYVYIYYDVRPGHEGAPFYVGKGTKLRYKRHLFETYRTTENKKKYAIINAIQKQGLTPNIKIYANNLTEQQAYEIEEQLITQYGRRDIDADGVLTNICESKRPPNNKGKIRPRGKLHPNFGKTLNLSTDERERRRQQIIKQGKKQKGENNPFYGKTHSPTSREKMSLAKKGNKINQGRHPTEQTRKKIQQNNPNRKQIHTPCGIFSSAEEFVRQYANTITANGLRNILKQADVPINKQRAERCNLFTREDIGYTPRSKGWYFYDNI